MNGNSNSRLLFRVYMHVMYVGYLVFFWQPYLYAVKFESRYIDSQSDQSSIILLAMNAQHAQIDRIITPAFNWHLDVYAASIIFFCFSIINLFVCLLKPNKNIIHTT